MNLIEGKVLLDSAIRRISFFTLSSQSTVTVNETLTDAVVTYASKDGSTVVTALLSRDHEGLQAYLIRMHRGHDLDMYPTPELDMNKLLADGPLDIMDFIPEADKGDVLTISRNSGLFHLAGFRLLAAGK